MHQKTVSGSGTKAVVSIRMDRRTLKALNEYARAVNVKASSVARGFIVDGLERAGMGMSSDELHELTWLRMKEESARADGGIKKVVCKGSLEELRSARQDLSYWLSRPAEERVAAVDHLRRQRHGNRERLRGVARVVQRA